MGFDRRVQKIEAGGGFFSTNGRRAISPLRHSLRERNPTKERERERERGRKEEKKDEEEERNNKYSSGRGVVVV